MADMSSDSKAVAVVSNPLAPRATVGGRRSRECERHLPRARIDMEGRIVSCHLPRSSRSKMHGDTPKSIRFLHGRSIKAARRTWRHSRCMPEPYSGSGWLSVQPW